MDGYVIKYEPKDNYGRTLINHSLFGRVVYRKYRGKQTAYYIPGFLDDIEHNRLRVSNVFVKELKEIDFDLLNNYANITITKTTTPELKLTTGRTYWEEMAKQKGVVLRVRRKTNN